MQKFLVIQTAFIGDVVLATAIIEKLHSSFPGAQIDFLLRKGNESLLANHPFLHETLVWDKKQHKIRNLWRLLWLIRRTKYDKLINVQRFAATGLLTAFSGAKETIGFDKNPLSRWFSKRVAHRVGAAHEIDRNQELIKAFTDAIPARPRLYPSAQDEARVNEYRQAAESDHGPGTYITISPASVWFTKQYPKEKWIAFLKILPASYTVYLLGAPSDRELCETIRLAATPADAVTPADTATSAVPTTPADPAGVARIVNLCGQLSFLQSAALQKTAVMNYTNDSAPMHFASAVNAPVTAVYCSTIPGFGFGPLSDIRYIVEIQQPLDCRPCGLHGYKACPKGHFKCAWQMADEQLLGSLK